MIDNLPRPFLEAPLILHRVVFGYATIVVSVMRTSAALLRPYAQRLSHYSARPEMNTLDADIDLRKSRQNGKKKP